MPAWPLDGEEPGGWAELWSMPQAVIWERENLERVVARYSVIRELAEQPGALGSAVGSVMSSTLLLEDRLLLSPYKLQQAHYRVAVDETAEVAPVGSTRDRLRAVG